MGRDAGEHVLRRLAEPSRPLLAHEVVISADPTARNDDRRPPRFELAGLVAVAGLAAARGIRLQHGAACADDRAALDDQLVDPVAEFQRHEPRVHSRAHALHERFEDAGAGAPHDVEARYRVAVPGRGVPAALGPADDGEECDAHAAQPLALLTRGELQVGLGPLPRPEVLVAVESGGAGPVLACEVERVLDAHPPLLGRVDEEQAAERPPGLTPEARLGLLLEDRDVLARVDEFRCGDEAGEACADHDRVGGGRAAGSRALLGRLRHPYSLVLGALQT